jgi:hypothetical protein
LSLGQTTLSLGQTALPGRWIGSTFGDSAG